MPRVVRCIIATLAVSLLAFILIAVAPRRARAQDATAPAADALFQSGKQAMERGDHDVACERFRESFRLQAAAGTLLNLGACEEKRGHYAVALQCFRDSLALMGAGDFRRAFASEHLAALRPKVASVRLVVEGSVPGGLQITQDGVALSAASLGVEFWVDPGEHAFIASAPAYEEERVTAEVMSGDERQIVFRLRKAASARQAKSSTPSADASPSRSLTSETRSTVMPWVLIGSGAVTALAGGAFGLVVMSAASDVRDHCDDRGCDEDGLAAADRGKPFAVLSPVLIGAGAALAAAGGVWLYLSRGARVQASALAPQGGAAGITIRGSF